ALMARTWPARDMAPLVALIADPRHALAEDGTCRLSDPQARAILDLRLQRLTALGRDEIAEALNKLADEIADYLDILGSRARIRAIIRGAPRFSTAIPTWRTRISSSAKTWSFWSATPAISSVCRFRPIARKGVAA